MDDLRYYLTSLYRTARVASSSGTGCFIIKAKKYLVLDQIPYYAFYYYPKLCIAHFTLAPIPFEAYYF